MAGKTHRLGRVAGELNVGVSTLIDFLNSKGIKQDVNPNSKLEEGHYCLLYTSDAADEMD
jgi:translation initiation factor IF-2